MTPLALSKVRQIAVRELTATVMTKGFMIAMLIMPVLIGTMVLLVPRLLMEKNAARIVGEIGIVDPTGKVIARARDRLSPQAFAERTRAMQEAVGALMPKSAALVAGPARASSAAQQGVTQLLGQEPELTLVEAAGGANGASLDAEKAKLLKAREDGPDRLALIVIHPDAVSAPKGTPLGGYDLYIRAKQDERLISDIRDAVSSAVIDARFADRALDATEMRALTRVPYVTPRTVDATGEKDTNEVAGTILPVIFMGLMLMAVMTAGQQLLTSTVEEKSSRVVEVLLAAVSPLELMAGKIIGQLGVALLMLGLYGGLGLLTLISVAALGLIEPSMVVLAVIFFLIGFVIMASMMAAIGSAVNELREAQSLLTPVMLVIMLPTMLWLPISRNPNSVFATVLSLMPPVSPFVMVLRLASRTPPPMWQVGLAIVIGVASMFGALWCAGKVFRVGLLLYGKPPDLATLVRWVRMG